jgi:hypothetical protein
MRRLLPFILCFCLTGVLQAAPAEVSRILRSFDFEEREKGNPEETPMNWSKVTGDQLPHYVNGQLATDKARSGKYSFRFDLNGGNLIYRYDTGLIKVQAGSHYRVEGYVSTTALQHARARMTAYFVDGDGRRIDSTVRHSDLYAWAGGDEVWKRLSVELSADNDQVAFLVLELELLQPSMYRKAGFLGKKELFEQDIQGHAWWDDVFISQVPQVTMTTDRPGNMFRKSDVPRLTVLVNDRFTDDLAAQLVIRDAEGKTVYQRSGALDMASAQTLGPGRKKMSLTLPELPAGWYEAALVMSSQGTYVGEQTLDLIRLADDAPPVSPDPRFGIDALELPFEGWSELPDILPYLAAGRVKLAVWSAAGDIQTQDSAAFDTLLERLGELGITPTACLVDLPNEISAKMQNGSWPQLLTAPKDVWQPSLAYLIARHANHLDRWQLGADGIDSFVTDPKMRQAYDLVYKEFANLVEKPDLAMPWPAWYQMEGKLPATVAMSIPASVLPAQLPLYINDIHKQEGHNLSITLGLLERNQYGRDVQIRDFAERVVYALAANAQRIDLPLPFTVKREDDAVVKQPQELLLIMRTLVTTLSGSTFRGKVPIGDDVEAFLFDKAGQGILVLWAKGSTSGVKSLAINLGQRPMRVDLWGNVSPMLMTAKASAGAVNLDIGPMPTILVDIDGPQAQLRASVAFDRPLLESSFKPHQRHIRFTNPYRLAIGGTLKLKAPEGWRIDPQVLTFTLNPGETFDREVTIEFPYNSFAGAKTIQAQFSIQGESDTQFTVPVTLNLGLSDVGVQTLAIRDGNDIVVQQMISNYGDKPIDYSAFAIYPGCARQERLLTNLGAGRTTIKVYRFNNVTIIPNAKVRSGVKELVGTRILNDEVEIK